MKGWLECELPNTTTALEKLWHVLSDPDCEQQEERKSILLETFFSVAEEGITLRDLQLVTKVLDVLAKKANVNSKYQCYFQKMLNLLTNSIRMEMASDQIKYQSNMIELFTTFGYILLRTSNKLVQLQVLDIILNMLLMKRIGDSNMIPVNLCVNSLELSELVDCLADLIVITEKEVYSLTIFTVLQISMMSKLCCWALLKKEVLEILLVRLMQEDNDDVAEDVCQILWTLLNCTNCPEDWEKIHGPSRTALRSLRYVLREHALTHCHPGKKKEILSNISALVLKIMHTFPGADYVLSGLIEDITISATLSECVLEIHIIPFFGSKGEYLHFKKLMLACLAIAPVTSLSINIFKRNKLAECLVSMLRLESCRSKLSLYRNSIFSLGSLESFKSTNSDVSWFKIDQEQSIDLFKSAIPVVCALFEFLLKRFISAGLINALISFLSIYYLQEKNAIDETFHTTIKSIFFVCFSKTNPELVRKALTKAGATYKLLCTFDIILNKNVPLTVQNQSTICHILLIVSALLEDYPELRTTHESKSFQIVQSLYHRILRPLSIDFVLDNRLTVAVSNFAWVALIKNEENLSKFIDSSEIYSHLDILERSTTSTQLVYLSTLVDIAENHKAVPYLVSWRGHKGIKLLSLLCKIWRDEEVRLEVPRDEDGCIVDIERPLMGNNQYKLSKDKSHHLSACDVFGSCRPKIYALVQLLHRHEAVTNMCEQHYRLGHDSLSWEDQVTMQVIEAYLPLKLGEVWWDIFNKQQGTMPLDRHLTQILADRYLNWSLSVQRSQHAVLKLRMEEMKKEEQQYYSQIRSVRLTAALESLRQVTAIARTADRQMLLVAHGRLREGIEDSRPSDFQDSHSLLEAFPRDVRVLVVNPQADVVVQHEPV